MQAAADPEALKRSCYCAESEWLTVSRFSIHHCPSVALPAVHLSFTGCC